MASDRRCADSGPVREADRTAPRRPVPRSPRRPRSPGRLRGRQHAAVRVADSIRCPMSSGTRRPKVDHLERVLASFRRRPRQSRTICPHVTTVTSSPDATIRAPPTGADPGRAAADSVQPTVLDVDRRVGVLDRGDKQVVGVGDSGRHDDLQTGDVRRASLRGSGNAARRRRARLRSGYERRPGPRARPNSCSEAWPPGS